MRFLIFILSLLFYISSFAISNSNGFLKDKEIALGVSFSTLEGYRNYKPSGFGFHSSVTMNDYFSLALDSSYVGGEISDTFFTSSGKRKESVMYFLLSAEFFFWIHFHSNIPFKSYVSLGLTAGGAWGNTVCFEGNCLEGSDQPVSVSYLQYVTGFVLDFGFRFSNIYVGLRGHGLFHHPNYYENTTINNPTLINTYFKYFF